MKNMVCRVVGMMIIAFGGFMIGQASSGLQAFLYSVGFFIVGSIIYDLAHRKEDY
ncbi:hypothetical protein HOBO_257 [Bacillus phage Hobo]|uniref:Uncharacterized protein n=2 Tax=Caeruleovirus BM15 TaxID=1985178 RepID=A0A0S2MUU8_9CAUD|nr:hypothetical protein FD732_gp084 [Bacillus phage BM15]ALO79665.1 hypothetical protein BM10_261 [Bacillus phage BM15]AXQ67012.1 hypothetical protein HOBO_257 [Bacillus phage Hobo]